jgi:F-type H+-transporting ATPase subunit c
MVYFACLALAVGLGVPIAVIGAGLGQGIAVSGGLQAMGRQPEAGSQILTGMIIGLAFIEALVIYALVMFFMLKSSLPASDVVIQTIQAAVK